MFVGGEPPELEEIARWSSDDLGYVVAVEHALVRRAHDEGLAPMTPQGHHDLPSRDRRVAPVCPPR